VINFVLFHKCRWTAKIDQVHFSDSNMHVQNLLEVSTLRRVMCGTFRKVCVNWSLFYIDFHEFNWCRLTGMTTTHSNLNVVSCGGGQPHIKPQW